MPHPLSFSWGENIYKPLCVWGEKIYSCYKIWWNYKVCKEVSMGEQGESNRGKPAGYDNEPCADCGGLGGAIGCGGMSGYEGPCHAGPFYFPELEKEVNNG